MRVSDRVMFGDFLEFVVIMLKKQRLKIKVGFFKANELKLTQVELF